MGPTNTGKTSLAIELSQRLDAEIISVDSVQIYKHANIGSNKLSNDNLRDYPHHLINFLEPKDLYSVGNFRNDVLKIISSIDKKNKSVILVGGTMMYFHSLFNGIAELPRNDPKVRKKLDEEQKELGLKYLFQKLQKIDKESAKNIHENDQQRIKRSLEVYMLTGKTHTELKDNSVNPFLNREFLNFAIIPEDKMLFKKKLKDRFLKMLDEGLIEETRYLIDNFSKNIKVLNSVGYKQTVKYLDGKISKEEMIEKATNANYQLSKRQITWLKKFEIKETFFANQSNMVIKILDYLE